MYAVSLYTLKTAPVSCHTVSSTVWKKQHLTAKQHVAFKTTITEKSCRVNYFHSSEAK